MIKKIKGDKGSIYVIVIVAMALVTLLTGTISMQVINVIKSNKHSVDGKNVKYAAESGVENTIAMIVNQIESQVNGVSNVKNTHRSIETIDKYGKLKDPLIDAYNEISNINNESHDIVEYIKRGLYEIIYTEYDSVQNIRSDINSLKLEIITFETSIIIQQDIKEYIIYVLQCMNMSLVNIYSSVDIHNNHEPVELETDSYWGEERHVKYGEVEKKFINYYGTGEYNYTVESIEKDINKLDADVDKLDNNISKLQSNSTNYEQIYVDLRNEIRSFKNAIIVAMNDLMVDIRNEFRKISNVSGQNIAEYESKLRLAKDNAINIINLKITDMINTKESELYTIFVDYFNKCKSFNDENLIVTKDILNDIETIKINLIELRCKLGENPIDLEDEIIKPDPPITETPTPQGLYIQVMEYEEDLDIDNVYKYKVSEIAQTPIVVEYNTEGNIISNVGDIELYIESEGIVNNNNYKIRACVEFKTTKSTEVGKGFITNYYIKSYDKVS